MNGYWITAVDDRPGMVNTALVSLFLLGIYVGVAVQVANGLPIPTVIAGLAGMLLLIVNRNRIEPNHVSALCLVIVLYLVSILFASDYDLLKERFKGLVQLSYSLIIGYGFFLAVLRFNRERLAWLLLFFCTLIVIGCALESYTGFRAVTDAFRAQVFSSGVVYDADIRDQLLYGGIRPKLFTSEPSIVTFSFTLFMFAWYVVSTWRLKLPVYLLYIAAGLILMRGPTLLVGVALIVAYQLFLAARIDGPNGTIYDARRVLGTVFLAIVVTALMVVLTQELYAERLSQILSGRDASFFGRIIAPALTAMEMIRQRPVAGAGLSGWEFIDPVVRAIYANSSALIMGWAFRTAAEAITNYFWEHWIFLGLVWGTIMIAALSRLLSALAVPAIVFTWFVWFCFGNAVGAYVSPRTWTVFFLAGAIAILHQRQPARSEWGQQPYARRQQFAYGPFSSPSYHPQ